MAKAKRKEVNDLRVLILDRERNKHYIDGVRQAGARISLIRDGDVAGAIATAQDDTAADILLGIGGSPEAVIAAAALKCMGAEIQCKLWPRNDDERRLAAEEGLDLDEVMGTDQLVSSENVFFSATGVTGGEYLRSRVQTRGPCGHPFGDHAVQDRLDPLHGGHSQHRTASGDLARTLD